MKNTSFIRKIIYLGIIGALIIPLSMISRPSSRGASGNEGGKLAQLRTEHDLSQANLMDIDPASETMKLATLGLRGVAVNFLWMQAIEYKKEENWDGMRSTLQALIKVQPNFIKVWEYQAHNLSYNISMEFDDYEYRYHWVKKGIEFLEEGIAYNRKDHRILDNLGFFTGMKLGRSDERFEFRRMFREDSIFHNQFSHLISPGDYDEGVYGYDNWKMAWNWYDLSQNLCKQAGITQHTSDVLYFAKRPAQLRNTAASLKDEFITGDSIQDIWISARDEWADYGRKEIQNSFGITVTLEGTLDISEELERRRAELDALAPGARKEFASEIMDELGIPEDERAVLDIPIADRNDEQAIIANRINMAVLRKDSIIDARVLRRVPEDKQLVGRRLVDGIMESIREIRSLESQDGISNYRYWRQRTKCESDEQTVVARAATFKARKASERSVFDDDYVVDRKTGEKTITRKGAISQYEDAFRLWSDVFEQYPKMVAGELGDSVIDEIKNYEQMLEISGIEWKDDFPLQSFIDLRSENNQMDELPTSQVLEERRIDREEELEEQMEDGDADNANATTEEDPVMEDDRAMDGEASDENDSPAADDSGTSDSEMEMESETEPPMESEPVDETQEVEEGESGIANPESESEEGGNRSPNR